MTDTEAVGARQRRRLRLMVAAFLSEREGMANPRATRLREAESAPARDARVIDAQFKVVRAGKRSRLAVFGHWMMALAIAASIGFLIPPAFVLVQEVAAWMHAH